MNKQAVSGQAANQDTAKEYTVKEHTTVKECAVKNVSESLPGVLAGALGLLLLASLTPLGCTQYVTTRDELPIRYDVLIRGGRIYDGSGKPPYRADIAVSGDRIVAIGPLRGARAVQTIDARGLAVAPGFINMLSWSTTTLIEDGRSQGELRQGVTTQIMGEGFSMGPLSDSMKKSLVEDQGDIHYDVTWTSLAEYLENLERRGVSQNVASFVGHTTLREYAVGLDDRDPTPGELLLMKKLLEEEMANGALGLGSSLIYAPASYAETDELVELCKVVAKYDGMYISHIRSEGNRLLEAIQELIYISREADVPAEIYHLKAAGEDNWNKLEKAIDLIESARGAGLRITADMYTYTAGATGLTASVPLWARDGGFQKLLDRIRDPSTRARILKEMVTPSDEWENLYLAAGSPERVLLVGFNKPELKKLQGKTLAEVAAARKKDPAETILDLMLEDETRVETVYFMMSEENVKRQIRLPWVSFGSDAASMAPEGVFLKLHPHPRAYGCFARLLGKYVRDEKVIPLEEAVRRLTNLPATNLGLDRRGLLREGMFADIVVFDPDEIADRATFAEPHQYAVGVKHVLVNGVPVIRNGEHTGNKPGRALWGPGRRD